MNRLLPSLGLLFAACSGAGGGGAAMEVPDLAEPPDLLPAYPAGPYAGEEEKTFPDFTFKGYWSPTATSGKSNTMPFVDITGRKLFDSGAKIALLQFGAFW